VTIVEAVTLESQGRSVRFVPHERFPGSRYGYFTVELRTESMEAGYVEVLSAGELSHLGDVLLDLHSHGGNERSATAYLADGALTLAFTRSPLGQLEVLVEAGQDLVDGPMIRYTMQADQSYLPVWRSSVLKAVSAFGEGA
jgi:hypothetical protein